MALIYAYLVSWVAGGMLLTGDLLLLRRATPQTGSPSDGPTKPPTPVWHVLLAMAAVGFGGSGLALEATGLAPASQRPALAMGAALGLLGLSALLGRRPKRPELGEPVA